MQIVSEPGLGFKEGGGERKIEGEPQAPNERALRSTASLKCIV
jgi:hypothetical protein